MTGKPYMEQQWHRDGRCIKSEDGRLVIADADADFATLDRVCTDHNRALLWERMVQVIGNARELIGGIAVVSGHIWDCSIIEAIVTLLADIERDKANE